MDLILIGCGLLLYVFFSYLKPKIAFAVLGASLPLYLIRFSVAGIPFTVLEGMILVLLIVCIARSMVKKTLISQARDLIASYKTLIVLCALLLLFSGIAAVYAVNVSAALGIYKAYFVEPIIVLFLFLTLIQRKKDVLNVLYGISLSVGIVSITAIIQYFFVIGIPEGYIEPVKRATSFFPYPAALALFLTPFLVLLVVLLCKNFFESVWAKYSIACMTLLGIVALVLSRAEGGIGALFVVLFIFGLFTKVRWYVLTAGVVGVLLTLFVPTLRMQAIEILTFQDVSGEVRLALWEGTANLIKAQPIKGAGLASFPEVYEQYKLARHTELLVYPHNIVLNFWVEIGLLGLLSIIGLLVYFFNKAGKIIKRCAKKQWCATLSSASLFAMVALIIYGLVEVPFFKNDLSVQFFLVIGLGVMCLVKQKECQSS
ncbi:O-antigen ligase family protein [Patescibacteria group bacterium]|nr:O-antigen ligase family protein [Patescibacteria group bacterium]